MRLSALDATFLELEDASAAAHMHVGAVLVFDGPPPSTHEVLDVLASRLPALPRFAQRLSSRGAGTLRRPEWVHDDHFVLAEHVVRTALPAPGGRRELEEAAAEFWSHRLGRDRPLWELLVVEGLARGRWALITKTHHCMVDGVAAVDAGQLMLDGMEPPGRPAAPADHRQLPNPLDVAAIGRGIAEAAIHEQVLVAPASSLTVPIGSRRRFHSVTLDLAELKAIKDRLGGTVNDVVLALVAGALRRLLLARGEEPPRHGLRAMVPVDTGHAGGGLGNHVSAFFVPLAVGVADPVDRYLAVVRAAETHKRGGEATGAAGLIALSGWTPPLAHSLVTLPLFARRLFNLTITNVRGPTHTVSALGRRMREVMPLVPLAADHALGVAVVSYDGEMFFGLVADREQVPDLDIVAEGIEATLAELRRAAGVRRRRRRAA